MTAAPTALLACLALGVAQPIRCQAIEELKAFARDEYPDDYRMQRHLFERQLSAYRYMQTVADDPIKTIATDEHPNDYTMQRYVYERQLDAKRRMKRSSPAAGKRADPDRPVPERADCGHPTRSCRRPRLAHSTAGGAIGGAAKTPGSLAARPANARTRHERDRTTFAERQNPSPRAPRRGDGTDRPLVRRRVGDPSTDRDTAIVRVVDKLERGIGRDELPSTWVAETTAEQVIGVAQLKHREVRSLSDFEYWLGGVHLDRRRWRRRPRCWCWEKRPTRSGDGTRTNDQPPRSRECH